MKWPTKGGLVKWSHSNPLAWIDLFVIEPTPMK